MSRTSIVRAALVALAASATPAMLFAQQPIVLQWQTGILI